MPIYQGDGKYEIELPYSITAVRELRVEHSFNEHAICEVIVDMLEEEVDKCIEHGSFQDPFLIRRVTKNGTEYWFAGGISNIDVDYEDGIAHVTIQGISRSYSLDQQLKSRSYQNKQTTYTEMIKRLVATYQGGAAMNEATHPDAKIGQLLVQYQETDWAFLKRLASKVGTVILPDMVMDAPRIYFGVPDFSWGKSMEAVHYEVIHDHEAYQRLLNREGAVGEVRGSDLTKYEVHSKQHYQVGDNVSFKGSMWVVFASEITYKQGTLGYKYTLMPRSGLKSVFRQNTQLQGIALEGKVISRGNNMVQVHLDIDDEFDDGGNWWFPYSSEGNNMFHALPEEGARIKIYFPDPTEKKAMAINSVRGKHEEMKGRTVFQKPSTKVFHIPGNAKMELGEGGVLFEKNTVQVHLDASNILLKSDDALLIVAKEGITLGHEKYPPDYIKMVAETSITMMLAGEKDYLFIEKQQVALQSEIVHIDVTPISFAELLNEEEILDVYVESIADELVTSERKSRNSQVKVPAGTYMSPRIATAEENKQEREGAKSRARARLESNAGARDLVKNVVKSMDGAQVKELYGKTRPPVSQPEISDEQRAANRAKQDQVYKDYQWQKKVQAGKVSQAEVQRVLNERSASASNLLSIREGAEAVLQVGKDLLNFIQPGFTEWYHLEYIIPQIPEYLSKNPDMGIYYSRYTFEQQILNPQYDEAGWNLLFGIIGIVAVVAAIPSGGTSLYMLLLAANGVVSVAQVGVSVQKIHDLNNGDAFSKPRFLGMNQDDLNVLGTALLIVDLKDLLQAGAKFARNGLNQARTSKALAGLGQQAQRIIDNAKLSAGRVGQKVKSGLHDLNVNLNWNNYGFDEAFYAPGVGGIGGKVLTRHGNEPLFSFSSGGGSGNILNDYLDNIVDASGNISHTKMNNLKNAIQKNMFNADELAEISKKMSTLGISDEYNEILLKIDFGMYLRGLIGEPPAGMLNPHAHHILFKKGLGEAQRKLVQEAQELLRKYGIDPIIGIENLVWAPNRIKGQHGPERLKHIVDKLKEVDSFGGTRERMEEMLKLLGEEAALMK